MTKAALLCAAVTALLVLARCSSDAQEWTRFRGPNGSGIAAAKAVPTEIAPATTLWKTELPGTGHSSPVLWGDRLFVTAAEDAKRKRHLVCIDAKTGRSLWTRSFDFTPYHTHDFNTSASSTPTVDAERAYVVWPEPERYTIVALRHDGQEVWRRDLGAYPTQHGGAASPILVDGVLIVVKEPEDKPGFIVGLDPRTGETLWKRDRTSAATAYATPVVFEPKGGGKEVVFTSTANGFTSLNPKTGAVNWELRDVFRTRCVAGPIVAGGMLFATGGVGGGGRQAFAVRPGTGGATPSVAYSPARGVSYVPTPIAVGDLLFMWGDAGVVTCLRATTGEQLWMERVGGNYFGSPVCVDGKLYAMSADGKLAVIAASETFKLIGKSDLPEGSHSTPAVANGTLYLRTKGHVIAVGQK
jgi:outer membrane protein assembly factor BamB